MSEQSSGQQFIRQVNDCIYKVLEKLGSEDGAFWCECDDMHCDATVKVTIREYAALRERGDGPLLSRIHRGVKSSPRSG